MHKSLAVFAMVADIGLAAVIATSFWPSGRIVAATARVAIGGMILGSTFRAGRRSVEAAALVARL
jgi:hypothetical protein